MTDVSTIETMLASLSAGKAAIERVPQLESELAEYSAVVDQLVSIKTDQATMIDLLQSELDQTQAKLKETEATLSAATFRESQTAARLETFQSLVRGALGTVTEAVAEAETRVEEVAIEVQGNFSAADTEPKDTHGSVTGHSDRADPNPLSKPLPPLPYFGHEQWHKPSSMTWGDWRKGGGTAPDWVSDFDN